ncbi:MAG: lipoprotein NlpI [Elusimicrobia bacterium ADurb.Bin231]|nr:MAG: lipoprotein NlpI [Elusimicrobia bacterium ADurb.Bin231]
MYVLKSSKKLYTYDQDKAAVPAETVKWALSRINAYPSPLIKSFYKFDNFFNVPQYRIDSSPYVINTYQLDGTNGKGAVDEQARASCIMEFMERYSCRAFSGWVNKKSSDFPADMVLPAECLIKSLNYKGKNSVQIIENLKDISMEWALGQNLTYNREVMLPKILYSAYSTGRASGNSIEEALSQGLCECVERHIGALVQWHYMEFPTVEQSGITNDIIQRLLSIIKSKGFDIVIKDFSGFMGIPALGVLAIDRSNYDNIGQTIGVAPAKDKALIRALTEIAQSSRKSGSLKNKNGAYYFEKFTEIKFLLKGEIKAYENVPDISNDDIKCEVERCAEILAQKGYETMFVDMTDRELNVPVVWVYIKSAAVFYANRSLFFQIGKAFLERKDYKNALTQFNMAQVDRPDEIYGYLYAGICLIDTGDYIAALENLKSALLLYPGYEEEVEGLHLHLGICCLKLNRYKESEEYLRKVLIRSPDNATLHYYLGLCLMEKGSYESALDSFFKAKNLINKMPFPPFSVDFQVSFCYYNINNYKDAEKYILKFINESSVPDWRSYNLLGSIYAAKRDYGKAVETLKKAIALEPREWINYNLIGSVYRAQNNLLHAETALKKAISLSPEEWSNYNILCSIYTMKCAWKEAVIMCEKALALCGEIGYSKKIKNRLIALKEKNR